jgi:hypothetical protein
MSLIYLPMLVHYWTDDGVYDIIYGDRVYGQLDQEVAAVLRDIEDVLGDSLTVVGHLLRRAYILRGLFVLLELRFNGMDNSIRVQQMLEDSGVHVLLVEY